ncbi:MAG: helix-turn-helix domain-containing protein [Bacteroidales bacterium]|nr:helix-turn-helix domain-containing protein [Bacteroidales bacterium]
MKIIRLLILISAMAIFAISKSISAPRIASNICVIQGMYNNTAWLVESLSDHSLLVGTDGNFSIYDGVRFYDLGYPANSAIDVDNCVPMEVKTDLKARLWIKNSKKLFVYAQDKAKFESVDSLLSLWELDPKEISNLFLDDEDDIWLLMRNGALMLCAQEQEAKKIGQLGSDERLCGAVQEQSKVYLYDSRGRIQVYDKTSNQLIEPLSQGDDRNLIWMNVVSCSYSGGGKVVAVNRGGEGEFGLLRNGKLIDIPFPDHAFLKMFPDGYGGIYVVCWMHVWHLDSNLQLTDNIEQLPTLSKDFNIQFIFDATLDWQGGMWLANYRNGLFYFSPDNNRIHRFTLDENETYNMRAMLAIGDRQIWYIKSIGLYCFDIQSGQSVVCSEIQSPEFFSIFYDESRNRIWISTRDGLYGLEPQGTRGQVKEHFSKETVKGIDTSRCLWAFPIEGTSQIFCCFGAKGIGFLDTENRQFDSVAFPEELNGLYHDFFKAYYDKKRGRVVMSSAQEVICYDFESKQMRQLFPSELVSTCINDNAHDFLSTRQGHFLAATARGIILENPNEELTLLNESNGIYSPYVHSVCEGPERGVWISTSRGIASIQPTSDPKDFSISNYSLGEALGGGEPIDGCLLTIGDNLWCGTSNGLILIENLSTLTSKADAIDLSPRLIAITINQDGELASATRIISRDETHLTLDYQHNFFTLHISDFNYMSMSMPLFSYQLEGIDRGWKEIISDRGGFDLSYTNVPPGRYTLKVRVKKSDGDWSQPSQWAITIKPPFYLTWWAYLLYAIGAIGLIWLCAYIYKGRARLLAQLREKRNKFIIQATEIKPEPVEIKSKDKEFLARAVALINKHLSEPDFRVEELSSEMGMSRSTLYRRVQQISGQTPTDFVNSIRIRHAARLLLESGESVKEVCMEVGFNDIRYFRNAFKKVYGISPQQYREEHATTSVPVE